ncbi:hypothetical protein CKAH01_06885 [Colletotrichum kahawae]|uniref:protein S-acyltransferase n=1 Tax=Colletotrichum kahawae TaxID=34407 RepID=A0AAD9Y7Y5_COLKA|nr:hypothetical protein CKAH01_06885 [Colletotrichum kahawae]
MPDSIDHIANFLSRNYHLETLYGGWSFWRSRGMHHKEHPNSGTGVHWAAYFGFVEPLEWLLEPTFARRGLSEESTKQDGDSFLTVELLLAKGARTEEQDVHGMGPLATAAISNAPAVIELLLKHDALIEAEDENGATPLALAVQHGALHAAQLLLQHQAAVNSRKKDGTTPLYDAVYGGQESLVKLLLSYGADISVRTQQPQIGLKVDIFFHSVIRSTTQIVQRLIQEGADLDGRAGDTRGPTALIYASKLGFLEKVRVLVEKGANVHETDEAGHTALYWATLGPKKRQSDSSGIITNQRGQ